MRRCRAWSTPRSCNRPIRAARHRRLTTPSARAIPGITDVVKLPGGVGVIGTSVEATQAAKLLLKVTWSDSLAASYDSEKALDEFAAIARDKSREGVEYAKTGDAGAAMQGAAKVMRAEFRTRHVYHAQMEPMNATASVSADGKSAELWVGTQGPSGLVAEVAGLLQTAPGNVKFTSTGSGAVMAAARRTRSSRMRCGCPRLSASRSS